jgi:hypothetical protein
MTLSNTMAYPSILLTKFSANSEYSPNTSSEATQSLSNDLRDDSHVLRVLVRPYRRSSWLFFRFSCSHVQYRLSRPAEHHRVRCLLGNDARRRCWGRGVVWGGEVVHLSHQAGEQEEERGSPSSLAEVVGVHPLHFVGALQ